MIKRLLMLLCLVMCGHVTLRAQIEVSSRPISPTVLATSIVRGKNTALIVLWRGSPGWFWRDGNDRAETTSGSSERMVYTLTSGTVHAEIEYDVSGNTARLLNREVSLKDATVVLVDNVDSLGGPVIVGERVVSPGSGTPGNPEVGVFQLNPDLYDFLQCHAALPASRDPTVDLKQRMLAASCDHLRAK